MKSFNKTAMAAAVAGTLLSGGTAQADVVNFSWSGAFTLLNPSGVPVLNSGSDYAYGHYADNSGDNNSFGAPTTHGWYGYRTPINGTLSFDTSTGAGVGSISPFQFFGDTPGTGAGTSMAYPLNLTFQAVDANTLMATLVFSWNGAPDYVSLVLNPYGLFSNLTTLAGGGQTTTLSGVGALPATDGTNFGTAILGTLPDPTYLPLGPSPVATTTLNTGSGCDALTLATQVNAYTIVTNTTNASVCATGMSDDGIGGDPMSSIRFANWQMNLDMTSAHFDSFVPTPAVPIPPAVWLFGSGLLGLMGLARRKRKAG